MYKIYYKHRNKKGQIESKTAHYLTMVGLFFALLIARKDKSNFDVKFKYEK